MAINNIEEIIEDLSQGKMVILMDDEDRENEGDIIIAADFITPESINFMVTHGRGLVCLTLTKEKCKQLNLPLMVDKNGAAFSTNFTVSIEAAEGVSTGISAQDRATTIKAAIKKDASAIDIVQPGHIFPLMSQDGGVLIRAGHTEAGCDLARLAGLTPASVIVEILNEDGTMARRPELEVFAKKHGIKIGTIADLIEYRNTKETSIVQEAKCMLPTKFGEFEMFVYRDTIDNELHYVLKKGPIKENILVRVHLQSIFNDLLFSEREQVRSFGIEEAMEMISKEGGVIVILGNIESKNSILEKVRSFESEDLGENKLHVKKQPVSSRVGVGSQILADLGVKSMRLLSSPKRYHLAGFGLSVTEYITK